MKIWLVTSGEPIPSVNERPHRTGILSKMLSDINHKVIWWTTTFDHQKKSYLYRKNTELKLSDNLNLFFLHSYTKYSKNISLKRIKNHREVSKEFEKEIKKKEIPDIILCSFPTIDLAFISIKYGLQNNIPVIIDVRDLWPDIFFNPFPLIFRPFISLALSSYFTKTKYIFKNASGIIGISKQYLNYGLNYAQRKVSKRDKIFPLGYYLEDINTTNSNDNKFAQLNINPKKINIWFIGTFGRTYDLSTVINAAKNIEKIHPEVNFIFTGDGEKLKLWKKQSSLLSNIIFTGWVGKSEIKYISSKSDIGIMAYSKGAPQGLPNKIFEFMSLGLPILSSLQGETKEFVKKERIGLSYIPNDHKDLIKKILTLINDKKLLKQMSYNCITNFRQKFDSKIIYNDLITYLEEIKQCKLKNTNEKGKFSMV